MSPSAREHFSQGIEIVITVRAGLLFQWRGNNCKVGCDFPESSNELWYLYGSIFLFFVYTTVTESCKIFAVLTRPVFWKESTLIQSVTPEVA